MPQNEKEKRSISLDLKPVRVDFFKNCKPYILWLLLQLQDNLASKSISMLLQCWTDITMQQWLESKWFAMCKFAMMTYKIHEGMKMKDLHYLNSSRQKNYGLLVVVLMYHHYNAWDLYNVFIVMSVCWKGILFTAAGQNVDARTPVPCCIVKKKLCTKLEYFFTHWTHLSVCKVVLVFSWIFQLGSYYVMILNVKRWNFIMAHNIRTLCCVIHQIYTGYSWISYCQISKHKLSEVKVLLNCSTFFIIGLWII